MKKPLRVEDHYLYWNKPPPRLSERCVYWFNRINQGWYPNRRIRAEGYDSSAQWYGVYIWEYQHILSPFITLQPLPYIPVKLTTRRLGVTMLHTGLVG